MKLNGLLLAAVAAGGLMLSGATSSPSPAYAQAKQAKPRTAKSLECSAEADKKGLKGKERRKFRSACKKGKTPPG